MQKLFFHLLLAMACLLPSCKRGKIPPAAPLQIAVATAREDSITMRYSFATHLRYNYEVVIEPRVSGYLMQKHYADGQMVPRGALLFEIDASQLRTSLLSAEAELAAAIAEQESARSDYERAIPLARLEAISASQLDTYRASAASAESRVRAAREQVKSASLQVGYTRIYAPISGIVAHSNAHAGDYVGPGTQFSTLTTIVATDTLTADIAIPTSLYMRYTNDKASTIENSALLSNIRLRMANGEMYPYEGRYDYTRQAISPTSGTITIVVDFPNPDNRLKPGEYGQVECGIGQRQRVVMVPQQAVSTQQNIHSVWVIRADSTAQWREVETGEPIGKEWIIRKGLSRGERVAVEGLQKLRNGERVIPKTER
ncbi:MAG: efflux RND transporter periplasmic adaptor subunit [Rikenellaceae bacterium]|nr:efflux RND transporter periplasmic adaptor subunit [Rikenellaceae bacterium]